MKKLVFICGPNGVGKSTVCSELVKRWPGSAYVDSDWCRVMNPFALTDETEETIRSNMRNLILSYLFCPVVNKVIFSYGFHGRRKRVFDALMIELQQQTTFEFFPILLTCDEEENIRRMKKDKRETERIFRALQNSRVAYDDCPYPRIDTSHLSAEEVVTRIIGMISHKSSN